MDRELTLKLVWSCRWWWRKEWSGDCDDDHTDNHNDYYDECNDRVTSSFVLEPTLLQSASTGSPVLPALCRQSAVSLAAPCRRNKVSAHCRRVTSSWRHQSVSCAVAAWRHCLLWSTCWWRHQENHVTTSMRQNHWLNDWTSLSTADVYTDNHSHRHHFIHIAVSGITDIGYESRRMTSKS